MAVISGNRGFVVVGLASDISAITKSATCEVTNDGLVPFVDGDLVLIRGVVGMTQVNEKVYMVSVIDENELLLMDKDLRTNIVSSAYTTYDSGGTMQKIIPITEWSLEESGEVSDVTDSTSLTYKDFVAVGFVQSSGKMKGWFREGEVLPALHTEMDGKLFLDKPPASEADDIYFSGKIILQSITHSLKIDSTDAVTVDYSWISGTGGLEFTDDNE